MNKTERMASALDDVLARLAQGEPLESCLARYQQLASELRPLVGAWAQLTAAAPAPSLTPAQVAARRQQYMHAARLLHSQAVSRSASARLVGCIHNAFTEHKEKPMLAFAFAKVAVVIAMLAGLAGGTTLTAQASLPDMPLYGIKLMIEDAQLLATSSAEAQTDLLLSFTAERVHEINTLALADRPISGTVLERLDRQTTDALQITQRSRDQDRTRLLEKLHAALKLNEKSLERTRARASAQAQDALRHAQATMNQALVRVEAGLQDPAGFQHGQEGTQPSQGTDTPGPKAGGTPQHTMTPQPAHTGTPNAAPGPHHTASPVPSQTPAQGTPHATSQPGNGPGPQVTPGYGNPTPQPSPNPPGNGDPNPTPQPSPNPPGNGDPNPTPQPSPNPPGNGDPNPTPQPSPNPPGNGDPNPTPNPPGDGSGPGPQPTPKSKN